MATRSAPRSMTIAEDGRTLYVVNYGSGGEQAATSDLRVLQVRTTGTPSGSPTTFTGAPASLGGLLHRHHHGLQGQLAALQGPTQKALGSPGGEVPRCRPQPWPGTQGGGRLARWVRCDRQYGLVCGGCPGSAAEGPATLSIVTGTAWSWRSIRVVAWPPAPSAASAPTDASGRPACPSPTSEWRPRRCRAEKELDERDHPGLSRRSIGTGVLVTCRGRRACACRRGAEGCTHGSFTGSQEPTATIVRSMLLSYLPGPRSPGAVWRAGPQATLRDDQLAAIQALVVDRRRAVVVKRTGWGKSAVYFLATRLLRDPGPGRPCWSPRCCR